MNDRPRRSRVSAVLVRGPGLPQGDIGASLEIEACLDPIGRLRPDCPPDSPWTVRRVWPGRDEWRGELVPLEEGWGVRGVGGDDEPVWELQCSFFRPGEYITLVRPNDAESVFRIVNVETG